MSLAFARMSSACHLYVLVCHPYVTRHARMYSCVIRMSLVCTRILSVYHSYLVLPQTRINKHASERNFLIKKTFENFKFSSPLPPTVGFKDVSAIN